MSNATEIGPPQEFDLGEREHIWGGGVDNTSGANNSKESENNDQQLISHDLQQGATYWDAVGISPRNGFSQTPCGVVHLNNLNNTCQLAQARKNRPGTKTNKLYSWPGCSLDTLDSPCSLQEYLQDLIRNSKKDIESLLKVPEGQTPDIWLYEHLRQVCLELSYFVAQIQMECTKEICPEMKANEWFYLCAAHPTPQSCCAIEYIVHTLDGASSLLNSSKYFPSRLTIPTNSVKHFLSIARRLYRIFAHAWYHHQSIFNKFESQSYLYSRFLRLSIKFSLIPKTLINIPDLSDDLSSAGGNSDNLAKF